MDEVFRVQFNVVDPRREAKIAKQIEAQKAREAARIAAEAEKAAAAAEGENA